MSQHSQPAAVAEAFASVRTTIVQKIVFAACLSAAILLPAKGQGAAVAGMLIPAECGLAIRADGAGVSVLTLTEQAACGGQPSYQLHYAAMKCLGVFHCP